MRPFRATRVIVSVLVLMGASAVAASAQKADAERATAALRRASQVEQQIGNQGATRALRLEAARLHIESVKSRGQNDPVVVTSLLAAAGHVRELDAELGAWFHRARLLASSPLLSADQRQRIMDRVYPAVAF